ncbi:MAG: hypothetical protein PHD76_03475 [Methylacidiphilales bacterium]|nr:hypothetical protein [Candidatus Methylacidiphilales bacterium]
MRIVVTGLVGQYPFGGVIWDYVQYILGFQALGHEVYYLEDTGVWPYDPIKETITDDCSYQVEALARIMAWFDLGDRWIYRNAADGKFYGAGETAARDLLKHGDLLVNVSTASWFEDYEVGIKHQMFLDGDPMFTQIGLLDPEKTSYTARLKAHDSHFSFGLNLNGPGCLAPETGIQWKKTLQPVALEYWPYAEDDTVEPFTTVMNWCSYKPKLWEGKEYGQKDLEFNRFRELPRRTPQKLVIAMGQGIGKKRPTAELESIGWTILEPDQALPDHITYRDFLKNSRGEWSIAKHGYVAGHTGWFSCRTACYLALGRPAVVQDTGWGNHLPHGMGLLPFTTMEDCVEGLARINRDYTGHRRAARAFAEKFLDARVVCQDLLEQAGIA